MTSFRHLAGFALSMGFTASASATGFEIAPAAPEDTDTITLTAQVDARGKNLCELHFPVRSSVTRDGTSLHVSYVVEARTPDTPSMADCPPDGTPVPVVVALGQLEAAVYRATFVGTTPAGPNSIQRFAFQVRSDRVDLDLPRPTVTPQPATPDDELTLTAYVSNGGAVPCNMGIPVETSLTRNGSTFHLSYTITSRPAPPPHPTCVVLPRATRLTAPLGTLPPGSYEVKVSGTTMGVPYFDQNVTFVVADPAGDNRGNPAPVAHMIPVGGVWGLGVLVGVLVLAGAWRLRAG